MSVVRFRPEAPSYLLFKVAGVAQLAEQLICNQQVAGSIPVTSSKLNMQCGQVPERPKGTDCKSVVSDFGGSNPPLPTKQVLTLCKDLFLILNINIVDSN